MKLYTSLKYWKVILQLLIIVVCLATLPQLTKAQSGPPTTSYTVTDTEQTRCYDNTNEISCPQSGEAIYGQDAQYNGVQPSYVDNGTVTDLNTRLMWQKTPGDKATLAEAVEVTDTLDIDTATATITSATPPTMPYRVNLPLIIGGPEDDSNASGEFNLFAPLRSTTTYLMDNDGAVVYTWASDYGPGNSVYLLENGNLLRTGNTRSGSFEAGGAGGIVQEIAPDGTVVWEFEYVSDQVRLHHDIEPLPNGNVLMIAWERRTEAEAIAAGRNPSLMRDGEIWPDHIIEVNSTIGAIVWEWHVWDHLIQDFDPTKENYGIVIDHPELVDLNFSSGGLPGDPDWNHTNSIDYDAELDQILLSVRSFSEIWVIDHSTTSAEAAGHAGGNSGKGGDLLYRWGNPKAYDAGTAADQMLFVQHDAQWIPSGYPGEGNILVFNNGTGRSSGNYSSVDEVIPPVDASGNYTLTAGSAYGPAEPIWMYRADNPTDFYANRISGAQRLSNGNTLICDGPNGTFFEVTPENDVVWTYDYEGEVFRVTRYASDYPGLPD